MFCPRPRAGDDPHLAVGEKAKVFCFFSSEKKAFLVSFYAKEEAHRDRCLALQDSVPVISVHVNLDLI
jgi:hypothetical protein